MYDVIQRVGNAGCISLCDATSGYWQTKIADEDRWTTGSFAMINCMNGLEHRLG